ncbi:MAG: hypothetical protein KDD40_12510, partial [Bdellovibrionales bacterium]|nr:hypothetical protein [Bdellovibrionales bacterium]
GLYPLAKIVADFESFREGALWVQRHLEIIEKLSAFYLDSFVQGRWISNFWLYSEKLKEFGNWLEQLWAESLGKDNSAEKRVSTPFSCIGTNDQHSLLEQMEEGFPDKSQLFLHLNASTGCTYKKNWIHDQAQFLTDYQLEDILVKYCHATYNSLDKHPRALMSLKDNSAAVLFALHLTLALTIGVIGKNLDIEIYGQAGVEKSKELFRQLL